MKCFKDSAAEDKKAAEASREELVAVKEDLRVLKAKNRGLLASLKERRDVFLQRGDRISSAFATALAGVGAYVLPFELPHTWTQRLLFWIGWRCSIRQFLK